MDAKQEQINIDLKNQLKKLLDFDKLMIQELEALKKRVQVLEMKR